LDDVTSDEILEAAAGEGLTLAGLHELGLEAHVRGPINEHFQVFSEVLGGGHGRPQVARPALSLQPALGWGAVPQHDQAVAAAPLLALLPRCALLPRWR